MRILKIKGKTEEIILDQVKKEYGHKAVVINTQEERKPGIRGLFSKSNWVVTIAIDDEETVACEQVVPFQHEEELKSSKNSDHEIILELKNQIEFMRQEVREFKSMADKSIQYSSSMPKEKVKAEKALFTQIVQSLKHEGIHEEVIEEMLVNTGQCESIEEAARMLYMNFSKLLPMAPKDQGEKIIFFVGSTGVGKTTTIAKLTADHVLNKKNKVVLFTADTYRIAAIEQLKTYADILDVPIEIIYSEEELKNYLQKWQECDAIFIDTAGRSHKNTEQIEDMKKLLGSVSEKKVYLVLNMGTNYKDIKKIVDTYKSLVPDFQLIITKMDETDEIGNLMNIAAYAKRPIAYVTTGQNVPDDIEPFNQDEYVKKLLGRIKYE